uniref:NADH-ubiquinone oxidoreductase chain 3 n=1 Tax=Alicella gigantea TaxID=1315966 RepID=A0A5B7L4E0_9CRUS|nr:NADH dehydrogenase subunit 3 [Alicella gigantea]QAT19464.1 NADH dehydrogenase subunit 3 [Alicella gigantea]
MNTMVTMFAITTTISMMIAMIALTTGKKSIKDREKLSPFECGFDPVKKARMPFSLRFFLVTMLFLIFDVEIALLLPLGTISKSSESINMPLTALIIMLILTAGLIHEWNQGALDWVS